VTIWANASVGSSFTGFSGGLSGTSTPQVLTMYDNTAVDAEFMIIDIGIIDSNIHDDDLRYVGPDALNVTVKNLGDVTTSINVSFSLEWWNISVWEEVDSSSNGPYDLDPDVWVESFFDVFYDMEGEYRATFSLDTPLRGWVDYNSSNDVHVAVFNVSLKNVSQISLSSHWNLIAIPYNESISKFDIVVSYDGSNYTWNEAVSASIILNFTYGWNRSTPQKYDIADVLKPGYGYWIWAYYDCILIVSSNADMDNYITDLNQSWNIVGIPFNTSLWKQDIVVNYEGTNYTWFEATTGSDPILLDYLYEWSSSTQNYVIIDILLPGKGYWIYAYYNCRIIKD
jgi:hypothetical protein